MTVISRLLDAGVEVHDREDWDSPRQKDGSYAARRGTRPMFVSKADYGFLHISVTNDTDTVQQGAAGARQIETYGYSTPPLVSYQWLVTNEGRVFEGQNIGVKGTHTINDKKVPGYPQDLNGYGYAVALMQNVNDEVSDVQVEVVAMIFAAMKIEGVMEPGAPILPHRMFAAKSCPGDRAMARLDEIRRKADAYAKNGLPSDNDGKPDKPETRISRSRDDVRHAIKRLNRAVDAGSATPEVKAFRKALRRALAEAPDR